MSGEANARGDPGAGATARAVEAAIPIAVGDGASALATTARDRPGAPRTESSPPTAGSGGPRTDTTGTTAGNGEHQPHGCEWPKYATGSGEEQAARAAENGGGGSSRGWKPATRHGGTVEARAEAGRPTSHRRREPTAGGRGNTPRRERDSPGWERRRGDELHGSQDVKKGRPPWAEPDARTGTRTRSSRVSESPGAVSHRKGNRPGGGSAEHAKVHVERHKDAGGAAKPGERLRRTVIR